MPFLVPILALFTMSMYTQNYTNREPFVFQNIINLNPKVFEHFYRLDMDTQVHQIDLITKAKMSHILCNIKDIFI